MALKPQGCSRLLILYPLSFLRANAWSSPFHGLNLAFTAQKEVAWIPAFRSFLPRTLWMRERRARARVCTCERESERRGLGSKGQRC